jgi:hypothetical protein
MLHLLLSTDAGFVNSMESMGCVGKSMRRTSFRFGSFKDLEDPRSTINRRHLLIDLIVICVLSVIAGADGPKAIGIWASSNADWLKRYLKLPGGIPAHDTIGRLLAALKPQAFQSCFQKWIANMEGKGDDDLDDSQEHIAIDGKALRRSHDRERSTNRILG